MSDDRRKNNPSSRDGKHSYTTGLIFSIILTTIPFWVVMEDVSSRSIRIATVLVCAIAQVIVHLVYFLHLSSKSENGWNLIAIVFSVIIIMIVVAGSLWIMWNLNYNMML